MNFNNIDQKICGYSLSITFFFVLISTAVTNIAILFAVISSLILIVKRNDIYKTFIDNKINLSAVLIFSLFLVSLTYTSANFDDGMTVLSKYVKFTYIPFIFYALQNDWIREKCINYFIYGCTIVLLLSYLKYFQILNPSEISELLGVEYNDKLLGTVTTVFQHSIIHGVILSFYSYLTFLKAKNTKSVIFLIFSFLSFYNVLFLNISRTAYLIIITLLLILIIYNIKKDKIIITSLALLFFTSLFLFANTSIITDRVNDIRQDIVKFKKLNYDSSLGLRLIWIDNGFENIKNKPLIGHGVGSYENTIKKYINNGIYSELLITQNPHNEFISISTQLGLVGLLAFLYFLFNLFKDVYLKEFGVCIIPIIIIGSLFNSIFFDSVLGIFSILVIGLAVQNEEKI
tara:strand:- start:2537 stop:3742 length:1206 start_codon:yes stop_codon:yes gene_type:complete